MNWLIFIILSLTALLSIYLSVKYQTLGNRLIAGFTLIILAMSLLTGLDYKTGEEKTFTYSINSSNILTESNSYSYTNYNNLISKGLALIIMFLGVLLLFYPEFERGEKQVLR